MVFHAAPICWATNSSETSCTEALSTAKRIEIRDRLTQVFEPIGLHVKKLKDTSEAEILKWFAARPRIQEEAEFLFRSEIYGGNPPFTTLTGVHEFQFHGQFLMDGSVLVSGFSASFYAGSSFENIPLLTKVILALKFMGHHTRPALFGELSEEDRNLLKNHSFTKLDLVNAMEFAYLSYVHGISLLSNDRPEESSDE
ncbi:MAG TPA: hypothetical protein DCL41_08985, partial [Bdellovibrionales bacterium]|nr:hypothetical protein [Bdellovibrionales bacterium]